MSKYWEDRALQRELEADLIAEKYMANMQFRLKETQLEIMRDIETFYLRYAVDNQLTLAQAKTLLTVKDDALFKSVNLKKFRSMAIEAVPENEALLKAISSRVRISRLEALNLLIEMRMTELYGGKNGLQEYAYTGLMEVYQNSYYTTMFDLAQGGIIAGATVATLKDQTMKEILTYNWTDKEFSKRIWTHKEEVLKTIRTELEKSFSSGRSIAQTSRAIADKTNVVYSKAEALVRTEANFFHNYAARNSYEEAGVEEYEILATLDSRTSEKCQYQDGKIYKTSQYQPGKTAPPFHVRCRTTTVAYFDENEYMEGEQRQSSGGVIDSMTYEEWLKEYIVKPKELAERKEIEKQEKLKAQIKDDIRNGHYKLDHSKNRYDNHNPRHKRYAEYIERNKSKGLQKPSYLTISFEETNDLVKKYSGSGNITLKKNGTWDNKELIISSSVIGIHVNQGTGVETPTKAFNIHYSKTGTHIVPTLVDEE